MESVVNFTKYIVHFIRYYTFSVVCLLYAINPKNYNPASRQILVQQIYYVALEILPVFFLLSIAFGAVVMGFLVSIAIEYNLKEYIGQLMVQFVLVELTPFMMALIISFRTGLRIGAKTAIMKVNNELNTLKMFDIDIVSYLVMPRAVGNMLGFLSLVFLSSLIMVVSGYVFLFLNMGMDINLFLSTIISAITLKDICLFVIKSMIYGFIIVTIPSFDGIAMKKRYFEIPLTISKTITSLFVIILCVEVLSLVIEFL